MLVKECGMLSSVYTMQMNKIIFCFIAIIIFSSCSKKIIETGKASYYADKFEGRATANGETFRQSRRTAAHKSLPFGTRVTVINLTNNKKVRVRINDRGPFVAGRIIDLSKKAARKIKLTDAGVADVKLSYRIKKSK